MPQQAKDTLKSLVADPQFRSLSSDGKRKALRKIDPDFSKLSDSGVDQFLSEYSASTGGTVSSKGKLSLGEPPSRSANTPSNGAQLHEKSPFPFTGPNAIQDAVAYVKSHPDKFPTYAATRNESPEERARQEKEARNSLASIAAGLVTLPFGGEGIWPLVARIAAAGTGAMGAETAMGASKKEAIKSGVEQAVLQGTGEGASALISKAGKAIASRATKSVIGGEEFPAIRGQAAQTPTVSGKVARGMGESFVGGPVAKKLAQQDLFFKGLISKTAESIGGVRATDPANFIESTFDNSKAILDKASAGYDEIRSALPNELTKEQMNKQVLQEASVFGGRGSTGVKDVLKNASPQDTDRIIANLRRSGLSDEEIYGENEGLRDFTEGKILTPREKFTALQKLRSQTSQAASRAYKRGLSSSGSMAEYGELSKEVDNIDGQILSTLRGYDTKLAKQFLTAKELHAQGRTLERFGTMLDSLTSGLSKAEASAKGIPSSELHAQSVNYGQLIEKIREFDSRGHFGSTSTLEKLFGKDGASGISRSVNLINNASKSNVGIVAHYLTTYGPAVGAGMELFRGRPEEAAMSAAAYPAMWAVTKLLSYPSFAEPFGKFLQASAGSKDAALWLTRAVQAGREITKKNVDLGQPPSRKENQ